MQERVVDEAVLALHVDVHHRLGNVVGEQPKLLLAGGQRLFGQLEIVYVVFGAIQPPDLSGAIEIGRDATVHPAPLAVGVDADALVFDVLAFLRALDDRPQKRVDVVRHDLVGRLAVDLILWPAYPVGECLVDERVLELLVEIGYWSGDVVGEQAQLRFLCLQRLADAYVILDIVDDRERATGLAAGLAVGKQRDPHPPQLPG